MKIDNKKKKIIIIAAIIILVAAIATTVVVLCSKKAKQSENTESQTVTVDVTDENGEIVTDENGNAVTEVEPAENTTKKADSNKKGNGKKDNNSNQENNNNNTETTESTTEYTTKSPMDANTGYDQMLDDDAVLTERNGLLALQDYYGDKYVVNYDEPNAKDGVFAYAVFEKDGDHKKIIYWVTAEEASGKAIQTDEKGKTKDITEQLKKFYW